MLLKTRVLVFLNPLNSNGLESNEKRKSEHLFIWNNWLLKSADTAKPSSNFEKSPEFQSWVNFRKVAKFNEILMSF